MHEYEITYLSDPQLTEEARTELDSAIDALLTKAEGNISFTEPNIRRRLFYPIKKQSVAFSRTINATLDPSQVVVLRETIAKSASIMRVQILKVARRQEVTMAIFDDMGKKVAALPLTPPAKKSERPVTMEEVEEKIEQALEEEVK
ncbi:MAG: 30S ribosomal protein S6 [Candidatus Andersenbacteria bacterium]